MSIRTFLPVVMLLAFAIPAAAQPKAKLAITGTAVPELAELDDLMTAFLTETKAPGASVAVAKDGRLAYCRGFGLADVERKLRVQPTSLFRIASITKTLTAATICRLVEDGKLALDDKVFDLLKLKAPAKAKLDARWKDITVKHLLEHKGGWDWIRSGDPMFKSAEISKAAGVAGPAKQEQIIAFMLGQPLDSDPGSKFVYSNFGYCLLGRVIEKASGKPYDKFVVETMLKPLGIKDTQQGKTLTAAKGEVHYYDGRGLTGGGVFEQLPGKDVPAPYGVWCLEAMDSHGGWISSAADLARFGTAFDRPDRFPAFKGDAFKDRFRADYYHTGGLAGTSTILRRAPNGITWVALFNSDCGPSGKSLVDGVNPRIQKYLEQVNTWPKDDLFKTMKYDDVAKSK